MYIMSDTKLWAQNFEVRTSLKTLKEFLLNLLDLPNSAAMAVSAIPQSPWVRDHFAGPSRCIKVVLRVRT